MSKRNPTYYEILGIRPDAKHNDVGLAYNRKVRALKREDVAPDLKAETVLKEAFEVLSDLDKREAYDAKGYTNDPASLRWQARCGPC